MGFTLAAALKATSISSQVVVAELVPEVIEWNKGLLGEGEISGQTLKIKFADPGN